MMLGTIKNRILGLKRNRPDFEPTTSVANCGPASAFTVAKHFLGNRAPSKTFFFDRASPRGTSLGELVEMLESAGLRAKAIKPALNEFDKIPTPFIAYVRSNHFVVVYEVLRDRVRFIDPTEGYEDAQKSVFLDSFSGYAVILNDSEQAPSYSEKTEKFGFSELLQIFTGRLSVGTQLLLLILSGHILAVTSPILVQLIIDRVLPTGNTGLLWVILLLMAAVSLVTILLTLIRQRALLFVSTDAGKQVMESVVTKLLSLRLTWFERRGVGDILSRVQSANPLQELVTQNLVQLFISSSFVVVLLCIMAFYSLILAFISFSALCLMVIARLRFIELEKRQQEFTLRHNATVQTHLIESIRGFSGIRSNNAESKRIAQWEDHLDRSIVANVRLSKTTYWNDVVQSLISAVETILFLLVAVLAIFDGQITLGAFFALMTFKAQLLSRGMAMISQIASVRMLQVHMDRLSDIVFERTDPTAAISPGYESWESDTHIFEHCPDTFAVKEISYRYSPGDPFVLQDTTIEIQKGSWTGISGSTGAGKSTLLKLLMGMDAPTDGKLLINRKEVGVVEFASIRGFSSCVMQNDYIFSGTISDAIVGFEDDLDEERLRRAAAQAEILSEIDAFPMRFDTAVGEGGTLLSGGQRQRLLLARALYREPVFLFLDEATSHLDPVTESRIFKNLKRHNITVIGIAHRKETLAFFETEYRLEAGKLSQLHK